MSASTDTDLRYPIGRFAWPATVSVDDRQGWIEELERLPLNLEVAVEGLSEGQLDVPYRPGGWTARQVVHHLADSHLNCYQRYRLALTEDRPKIKPYDEAAWAELPDAKLSPIRPSLTLLRAIHERWTILLHSLTEEQWERTFVHPDRGEMKLDATLGLYAWHSRHHVGHIRNLRSRQGWD